MNKLISMLLVISLLVCFCPFAAAQDAYSDVDCYAGFHAPTVRKMIEVNLECSNVDEEFFHILANAYLANPELLIETILDLPQEDIAYLTKAIAYDLQKTERQTDAPTQTELRNPAANAVSRLIALETADTANAFLDAFFDEEMLTNAVAGELPDADLLALDELEVSTFGLSTNESVVASPTPATISLSSTLVTSTRRTYTIKFYKQQENDIWQCGKTLAMLDPNTTTTTSTANLIFNAIRCDCGKREEWHLDSRWLSGNEYSFTILSASGDARLCSRDKRYAATAAKQYYKFDYKSISL